MSIVDYFGRMNRESSGSDIPRPIYRSWWFGIPLALCVIDTVYEIWILARYWGHLPSDARFWFVFLAAVTTFTLIVAYSEHRAVREAGSDKLTHRLSVTTVFVVSWSYFLLGITLHLILQFLRHG